MKLTINNADVEVDDRHAKTPLLWVLRDVLGLHGTKFGCGIGYCAACTVLLNGKNTKSCQTPAERGFGKTVVTVEAASGPVVDAVRDAWYRGKRRPVRLLSAGPDAGCHIAAGVESGAGCRTDRHVDERQPVPVRHLSSHQGCD